MTLTPERIAEIEREFVLWDSRHVKDGSPFAKDALAELCRLARLGLRVEGAPTCLIARCSAIDLEGSCELAELPLFPAEYHDKRVALVVLEDSK